MRTRALHLVVFAAVLALLLVSGLVGGAIWIVATPGDQDRLEEYQWSASEQAQRDQAIAAKDSSLLPACTEEYFAWREETKAARESARRSEPVNIDFWSAPGCRGTPDRLVQGPATSPGPAPSPNHASATRQAPPQASDNAILAAETGLPLVQIDSAIAFQEAFGEYAEGLMSQYPGQISGVWMDSPPGALGPSTRGHIRFTGEVPEGVTDMENVVLTGEGLISMADQSRRAEIAAQVLVDLGYTAFATFFSPSENTINIELLLLEGVPEPSKSDLVTAIQQHVQRAQEFQGRASQVVETDVALTVLRGSGPFIVNEHSRGGNWLLDDGDYRVELIPPSDSGPIPDDPNPDDAPAITVRDLPSCDDIELPAYDGSLPAAPPTYGNPSRPGNILCGLTPTQVDTPRPGPAPALD